MTKFHVADSHHNKTFGSLEEAKAYIEERINEFPAGESVGIYPLPPDGPRFGAVAPIEYLPGSAG